MRERTIAYHCDVECVGKCDMHLTRYAVWSTARYASYTNVSPSFPADLMRHYPSLFVLGRQMRIYDISALPQPPSMVDMASEIALVLAAGTRFYKGRYCGPTWRAVLQTAGEYRLLTATADKLNVSHSFVSKSDRKQAAGHHLASLSYPVSLPAGISFWRTVRFPHVRFAQIKRARRRV